jgi:sodium-dependent dicarboxylate transporter 2/3/5
MAAPTRDRRDEEEGAANGDGGIGRGGTYRTLDEQTEAGRLSPAEERFERRRRTVGLFLGPLLFALVLLIPFDLEPNQHRLAAILALVVAWWVTEAIPIPITALLGVGLVALLEATPPPPEGDAATDVVFGTFADDTIFLFIGSFIIARAMIVHGLDRRFAYLVLSIPGMARSTYGVIIAFGLIALSHGFVGISNTATTAMLSPSGSAS